MSHTSFKEQFPNNSEHYLWTRIQMTTFSLIMLVINSFWVQNIDCFFYGMI